MELTEKTLSSTPQFHGVIVDVRTDKVLLPDGREAGREVVTHPGGVAILPLDDQNRALLVRQFRYPVGQVLLEAPAGKLEHGEIPQPAALRELEEEVGVIPGTLTELGSLFVSPGISTEVIHLYLATDLKPGRQHLDQDEFLAVEAVPFAELLDMTLAGQVPDAKTAALVMKTALLKQREERP